MKRFWRRWVTAPYYAAVNRQLADEVNDGATVFDLGCADGELLLKLAPRIDSGIGIDIDEAMISAAVRYTEHAGYSNLTFADGDANTMLRILPVQPTVAVASLLLSAMPRQEAQLLAQRLSRISDTLLIADFVEPPPALSRLLLMSQGGEADYYEQGGMRALLHAAGVSTEEECQTAFPWLRIWRVRRK